MRRRLLLAALAVSLALAGCVTQPAGSSPDADSERLNGTDDGSLERIIVEEDGVVCYYYRDEGSTAGDGGAGGLSCLPLDETEVNG